MEKTISKSKNGKTDNSEDALSRKVFLKLSHSERSKILKKRAENMLHQYEKDNEWKEVS